MTDQYKSVMSLPASFEDVTEYGADNNNELALPTSDSIAENNQVVLYTGSGNGYSEMELELNSPSNDLTGFYPNDLLQINDVFGDKVKEIPMIDLPDSKKNMHELIVMKETKTVPQVNEAIHQGTSFEERSNNRAEDDYCSRDQVTHRLLPSQQPLGRSGVNPRNVSNVNGKLRTFTQIIYSTQNQSSEVTPLPSTSQMQKVQQDDYRVQKIERFRSTCVNTGTIKIEAEATPRRYKLLEPVANHQSRLSKRRRVQSTAYQSPKPAKRLPNVIHREGSYFYVTTLCGKCKNQIEHTMYKPGHWPPNHCSHCGGKCTIIEWRTFSTDTDDEIVILGEFISSAPPKSNTIDASQFHNLARVKVEPVEDMYNTPSCRHCGGHHSSKGGSYKNFCPQYGDAGNRNFGTWN